MDSRLLSIDDVTGIEQIHHFDESTGDTVIETRQDVEAILEDNKRLYNDAPSRIMQHGVEMRRVAQIPLAVWAELRKTGVLQDEARMKAWLNDRDNRVFRTTPERV